MSGSFIDYDFGDGTGEAYVAGLEKGKTKPAVSFGHAWAGQGEIDHIYARKLEEIGYIGIAIDMFGKGVRGNPAGDNSHLIGPLLSNRTLLLSRVAAALKFAQHLDGVDKSKIAIMGFCFGGLCALDLARCGSDEIKAAISFHGLFHPNGLEEKKIKAKILILHGFDDPMANPEQMVAFGHEMTRAEADWQIHAFGLTSHAFTNPAANNPSHGLMYKEQSATRAWRYAVDLFKEVLG